MATTVVSLKGRLAQYGPRLEHAPADLLYVGRHQTQGGWILHQHRLHNPHSVGKKPCRACHGAHHDTREEAVTLYCRRLLDRPDLLAQVPDLRGLTLACWCAPLLCHAHVLAALADAPGDDVEGLLRRLAADPALALGDRAGLGGGC